MFTLDLWIYLANNKLNNQENILRCVLDLIPHFIFCSTRLAFLTCFGKFIDVHLSKSIITIILWTIIVHFSPRLIRYRWDEFHSSAYTFRGFSNKTSYITDFFNNLTCTIIEYLNYCRRYLRRYSCKSRMQDLPDCSRVLLGNCLVH